MDKELYDLKCQIQEFVKKYQINDINVYIEKDTVKRLDEEVVTSRNVFISVEV